jgi:hypothetical protein
MLAYDVDSNTVTKFQQDAIPQPNTKYVEGEKQPLDLKTTKRLRFVKGIRIYTKAKQSAGLALLFTDDQHVGTHRLVIVGLDVNRQIVQQTLSWTTGVPADAVLFRPQQSPLSVPLIAVISSTSPEAMVFQPYSATHAQQVYLDVAGPEYFEIGLGASLGTMLTTYITDTNFYYRLLVADNEKYEARIFGLLP